MLQETRLTQNVLSLGWGMTKLGDMHKYDFGGCIVMCHFILPVHFNVF